MASPVKKQKTEPSAKPSAVDCQHVLVMRHGNRVDDGVDDSWWTSDPKPWDPPLAEVGWIKALETGKKLRAELGFPIHRIVVSPFQRCIKTAQQLIAGLSMANDDATSNPADSSTSRIKVSLEYGMSEMMNDVALWYHPTDRNSWGFNIEELEALFPQRVVEITRHRVFMELPQWGESESGAKDRYLLTIHSLVDRYPEENLLFITHGEGVKVTASTYWKKARGHKIRPGYFGYAHLQRQIIRNGDSFTANRFGIATDPNETGIKLEPPRHA
ncbi:hypothetical protein BT93_L4271 [Corymbia citriodora subsp. variegata]|uniref:Phosphoglycerate mutase n=1 Tax=Corymbia citriodora subsp. variegata TaxID=360336 RepID=A0A8T0CYH6_CORYI|nr:hypothetical protein BT93_L4271 [Corymbia citriodora subsp. variegata]